MHFARAPPRSGVRGERARVLAAKGRKLCLFVWSTRFGRNMS
jgi:hypothetical protein